MEMRGVSAWTPALPHSWVTGQASWPPWALGSIMRGVHRSNLLGFASHENTDRARHGKHTLTLGISQNPTLATLTGISGGGNGSPLQHSCLEWAEEPRGLQSTGSQRVGHD